jgi:hypothetical protein
MRKVERRIFDTTMTFLNWKHLKVALPLLEVRERETTRVLDTTRKRGIERI